MAKHFQVLPHYVLPAVKELLNMLNVDAVQLQLAACKCGGQCGALVPVIAPSVLGPSYYADTKMIIVVAG